MDDYAAKVFHLIEGLEPEEQFSVYAAVRKTIGLPAPHAPPQLAARRGLSRKQHRRVN